MSEKPNYKDTLNLPKTDFPQKANLAQREPGILEFWEKEKIYAKIQDKNQKKPKYILHDGPPYPNGDIHLGHALNKILKDIVVKYKAMNGFCAPYVPGWDCHGLPIEIQVLKEMKASRHNLDPLPFRQRCREFALRYVDTQRQQFKRLGVLGDWDKPYLTLDHVYEEKILEVFGKLAENGYVFRALKPIHWCPTCETALAEAELEYEDDPSPSIYLKFPVDSFGEDLYQRKIIDPDHQNVFLLVWTTTPWTLPANTAVAVHPDFEYVIISIPTRPEPEYYILAEGLLKQVAEKVCLENYEIIGKFKGKDLLGTVYRHPFKPNELPVVTGHLVTLDAGTGIVHIAPGHGQEDHEVGRHWKLPTLMPVDEKGVFTEEGGDFAGLRYDQANPKIVEHMQRNGTLLFHEEMKHSYPHCWRCHKPVIFRATQQWFIAMDEIYKPETDEVVLMTEAEEEAVWDNYDEETQKLKKELSGERLRLLALKAIEKVKWYPAWGQNRITGMVEGRPDWCISRQRFWGVPIPAFYCTNCGYVAFTGAANEASRKVVAKEGTDGWLAKPASEILPKDFKCPNCQSADFIKEEDIMDVWLESGSSHEGVLKTNPALSWPADLYLEGSDQHRGWFQSSLLAGVGASGGSPYRAVLTHGFTVDESGKKMSKSLGNVVSPQEVYDKFGADILRLWVASADFRNDMSASPNIIKKIADTYTKIRNTFRFLLSNLGGFTEQDKVPYDKLTLLDKWALYKLAQVSQRISEGYDNFEFHIAYHLANEFCVVDLSAKYLDLVKDILYCEAKDSQLRRGVQTVLWEIARNLVGLLAPIMSFTAEEIWQTLAATVPTKPADHPASIFLADWPKLPAQFSGEEIAKQTMPFLEDPLGEYLFEGQPKPANLKEGISLELEKLRQAKTIGSSLDSLVTVTAGQEIFDYLKKAGENNLTIITATSDLALVLDTKLKPNQWQVSARSAAEAGWGKCVRCWHYSDKLGQDKNHPELCPRCTGVANGFPLSRE